MAAKGALILDFDGAVLPLPGSKRLPLGKWQESVRFGCTMDTLTRLENAIASVGGFSTINGDGDAGENPAVFLGSGDYHHVSYLLIRRFLRLGRNLQVVVFDNHPDNMRYPFGIHCGSWVWHVSRLPFVACVHVLGITSKDVHILHAWENHLWPLRTGKVRYWCVGCDLGWARWMGLAGSRSFSSASSMLDAFTSQIKSTTDPLYLSVDKDVLRPDEVRTNWDQGIMSTDELSSVIRSLRNRIVGSDVTGEASVYRYQNWFKRLLSRLDSQPEIAARDLERWQLQHQSVNQKLLRSLHEVDTEADTSSA